MLCGQPPSPSESLPIPFTVCPAGFVPAVRLRYITPSKEEKKHE